MRAILLGFVFAFCTGVVAEVLGQRVDVFNDGSQPQLGVFFASQTNSVWILNFSLWGPALRSDFRFESIEWRLFDQASGQYLSGWARGRDKSQPTYFPGELVLSLSLQDVESMKLAIGSLKDLVVVLSVNSPPSGPVPSHYVDLGSYCATLPGAFYDTDTDKKGCPGR